ncbi:MAG: hypothetical protein MMC23_006811 [Stictis urceolatum]|nr:hypothetical protein [Stictis urceolata]
MHVVREAYQQYSESTAIGRAQLACALAHRFLNIKSFFAPSSPLYTNRTRVNWSENCWQNASCFVSPGDAAEVSRLLHILSATQSKFSVRSGGHDFNINHSSVGSTGIVIDTSRLSQITLAADKKTATLGVGAHWGEVYKALNGSGVSVNGARSPNPGVGGQTLGGGVGWLSPTAGVCAASVVGVDVVLANGTRVYADSSTKSDLLWAVRGGGPNFGIIISYTYETLPIDTVWFESRLYTADKNQELINALVEYEELAANDSNASIVYSLSESTAEPASFVGFLYLEPTPSPAIFEPFYKVSSAGDRIKSTIGTIADLSVS